jgi:hypothetical protein
MDEKEAKVEVPVAKLHQSPTTGWVPTPQLVLCWVRAAEGKIVELKPAHVYGVEHIDTGTGEPHDILFMSEEKIPK